MKRALDTILPRTQPARRKAHLARVGDSLKLAFFDQGRRVEHENTFAVPGHHLLVFFGQLARSAPKTAAFRTVDSERKQTNFVIHGIF
jgi:hypothetical protein